MVSGRTAVEPGRTVCDKPTCILKHDTQRRRPLYVKYGCCCCAAELLNLQHTWGQCSGAVAFEAIRVVYYVCEAVRETVCVTVGATVFLYWYCKLVTQVLDFYLWCVGSPA